MMSSILEDAHDLCILIDLKLADCSLPRPEFEMLLYKAAAASE